LSRDERVNVTRRNLLKDSFLTLAGSAAGFLAGSFLGPQRIEVTEIDLGLGHVLAFVPDLHVHYEGEPHVDAAIRAIGSVEPDVLVIGGDLVDEMTVDLGSVERLLRDLDARRALAVLGNHEYWSGLAADVVRMLRRNGFEVLIDRSTRIGEKHLLGLDWRETRRYGAVRFDGLVVVHDPNAADSVSGRAFVLAGHTHGGLTLGGLVLYTNSRYNRGRYRAAGGAELYVSRGLGQMHHQVRIGSPPELVVVR
jgi:predicted MPP superfamily phosphohydrolase